MIKSNKPNFHIPVAVLLHKLVPVVVKSRLGLLVGRLHHLLQVDPDDAEALAGQAVQGGPVSDICPLCHGELSTVLVCHNSLLSANFQVRKCFFFILFYFVRMLPENE